MDTTAGKEFNPQLKDGLVGKQLVNYFATFGVVPVEAVSLGGNTKQMDYRITFEDGIEMVYRVTFGNEFLFQIVDARPYPFI